MRFRKFALVATLVAIVAAVVVASCTWRLKTRTTPVDPQADAPSFSLPDHNGKQVSLDSLTANGPAVLVFYRGYW